MEAPATKVRYGKISFRNKIMDDLGDTLERETTNRELYYMKTYKEIIELFGMIQSLRHH